MIKNELQYRVTKSQLDRFEDAIRELRDKPPPRLAKDEKLRRVYEASMRSQIEDLTEEIADYEALSQGSGQQLQLESFDDLSKVLVQARIAAGLSHRELAQRLSIQAQQIQRYESTEYASASLSRIKEIALALGLQIRRAAVLERSVATGAKRAAHVASGRRGSGTPHKVAAKRAAVSKTKTRTGIPKVKTAAARKKTAARGVGKTHK